jgi:NitT/TauT family transport system substrate-binding protein
MRTPRIIAILIGMVLILAACGEGDTSPEPTSTPAATDPGTEPTAEPTDEATPEPTPVEVVSVDFRLNWVVAGNHAPYFLALQEGYWEECGLDVSMAAGQGSGDTAQQVANQTQEFGLTDAVSIVAGQTRGLEITALGVVYQTNPSSIVSKRDSGIETLQDVEGKTWGAVPGGSPYLLLNALFEENDIDTGSIREVSVPAPGIAQLLADQVDFITFFGNEAANIDPDPEANLNVIPFSDYGQDIYGLAIASHPDYIAANPDRVRCFVDGVRRGFEAAADDPEAAIDALEAANPETAERRAVHERLLEGAFEYAGDDLLVQSLDKWTETQRVLSDAGIIETTVDPEGFFTDEYQ